MPTCVSCDGWGCTRCALEKAERAGGEQGLSASEIELLALGTDRDAWRLLAEDTAKELGRLVGEARRERDEARDDLNEMRRDRDSMKAWAASLFAHLCRLTGKDPRLAPQELQAITKSYEAEKETVQQAIEKASADAVEALREASACLDAAELARDVGAALKVQRDQETARADRAEAALAMARGSA